MVTGNLAKVEVEGSNPFARSTYSPVFDLCSRYAGVSSNKYLKFYIFGDGLKLALNATHLLSS